MNRRRLLMLVSSLGAAVLASSQKADKLVGTFHIDPNDPYGKLKQYRSSINILSARLAVAFQNLFSISELYKEGPRGDEILKASLEDIKKLHAELNKYLQKAPEIRQTIQPGNAKLLSAYDEYIKALAGVAAIDYGDISQERIDALVQAGSNMEPLIP
jgi:hypothetical protein